MFLTEAQKSTFKAAIAAETDPVLVAFRNEGATGAMGEWYSGATTFIVWNSKTPTDDIYNAINWKNFTPADPPDGTLVYQNRETRAQIQQDAVFGLLKNGFASTIDMSKPKISSGVQDALTDLYTGSGGALLQGGWSAVKTASTRAASRGERIFATGAGTNANPGTNGPEGIVSNYDILAILAAA